MPLKVSMMIMLQKTLINRVVRKGLYRTSEKSYNCRRQNIELLVSDKFITTTQMAIQTGKSRQTIPTRIKELQGRGVVKRNGPDKGGFWEILLLTSLSQVT